MYTPLCRPLATLLRPRGVPRVALAPPHHPLVSPPVVTLPFFFSTAGGVEPCAMLGRRPLSTEPTRRPASGARYPGDAIAEAPCLIIPGGGTATRPTSRGWEPREGMQR